jgi:hypothetical protein
MSWADDTLPRSVIKSESKHVHVGSHTRACDIMRIRRQSLESGGSRGLPAHQSALRTWLQLTSADATPLRPYKLVTPHPCHGKASRTNLHQRSYTMKLFAAICLVLACAATASRLRDPFDREVLPHAASIKVSYLEVYGSSLHDVLRY